MLKELIILSLFSSLAFCTTIMKTNSKNSQQRVGRSPQYDWFDWLFDYEDDYSFENSNVTSK